MPTERQIEANQANALKSTGPKTAEGKAAARRNALKHGMTCKREGIFADDDKLYRERLEGWTRTAKPRNDMELYQLESAVRATVNLDRCARNERAVTKQRERKAEAHWKGVQTKKLDRVTESWTAEPAVCVAQLESFTRGCEWLLESWELLAQALEANKCWTVAEAETALRLMGKPEITHEGDDEGASFRSLVVAASSNIDAELVDTFLGIDTSQLEPEARRALLETKLLSREEALEGLWAALDAELERLEAIRASLWESKDGPALSEQINLASFDGSKKGVLRRRYQSANHLDMHRCLKELTEQKRLTDIRVEEERLAAEARVSEERANEKKARAARATELYNMPYTKHAKLRNEAKSSDTKETRISTSGKSAVIDPRHIPTLASYTQSVPNAQQAASEGARPANPVAPGAGEAQKPS